MEYLFIIALSVMLVGLSKGGLGAPLAMLVAPVLSFVMPVQDAVSLALPLLIAGDVFALWFYWKTWDMRYIWRLLPAALVGIVVGTLLLASLDDITLRHILGIFTLFFVIYRIADHWLSSLDYQPQNWHGWLAGAASGVGSALANAGGPPFTIYMLLQDIEPRAFVGTMTLFFAIVNALKIPGYVLTSVLDLNNLLGVVWALPLLPVGVWIGRMLIDRINQTAFEWFMLITLLFSGIALLLPTG